MNDHDATGVTIEVADLKDLDITENIPLAYSELHTDLQRPSSLIRNLIIEDYTIPLEIICVCRK